MYNGRVLKYMGERMSANLIDGKAFAADLRLGIAKRVAALKEKGKTPGLAVIIVGDDPASHVYVSSKAKQTVEVGMNSFEYKFAEDMSESELLELIDKLNKDDAIDGILVQLPLPKHIDSEKVLNSIAYEKDVDGFHPMNVGLIAIGSDGIIPCTPKGSMLLLKSAMPDLSGKNAVIIGRSNIVGKPMAQLLLAENCTVTIAHSKTQDLPKVVAAADIVVAAVGRPQMVKGEWIKQGAVVIDVGINRIVVDGKNKLVGDVDFAQAKEVASAITPVPGGVGPMTIACLLLNTLEQAEKKTT